MSRVALGLLGGVLIVAGIFCLIGYSAGWALVSVPVWVAWLSILVGIVSLIIAAADTKDS